MKKRRSFWKWLYLWARAGAIEEARRKRIMRENLETWNRENRAFIEKSDRREAANTPGPSADEANGAVPGHGTGLGF